MLHPAIEVQSLYKTYRLYGNPYDRIKERILRRPFHGTVHALSDINLTMAPGQCVGLVGGNGAGKSTLLKILTGTTFPTSGSYTIRGRVASLLELGAGFHLEFSGRENIYMNAALMGFSRDETEQKFQEILDFSELGHFIEQPIRTYSSGMACRLGFSCAVATEPDVLIIDEILAVGDMHFRRKCVDKIMKFRERGKTMLFCSHSLYDVRQMCDRAIWLRGGKVAMFDDAVTVTNEYATYENQIIAEQEAMSLQIEREVAVQETGGGHPDDHARIVSAHLFDPASGQRRHKFQPRERVGVRVHVKNGRIHEPLTVAVGFMRKDGTLCFAPTTEMDGVEVDFAEGIVTLILPEIPLLSGEYIVPVFLLDARGVHRFHEQPCTENLIVQNRSRELGLFWTEREWQVEVIEPAPAQERS